MNQSAYALFETPLGVCGIAWRNPENLRDEPAVVAFQLPEANVEITRMQIEGKASAQASPPPSRIAEIIKRVRRHLGGEVEDFQDIAVDLTPSGSFAHRVYAAARKIPPGQTMTYGELANAMHRPKAARAVGQALGRNPIPLIIPCHRVLAAGAKPGGFSASGGIATKLKMLAIEGATLA